MFFRLLLLLFLSAKDAHDLKGEDLQETDAVARGLSGATSTTSTMTMTSSSSSVTTITSSTTSTSSTTGSSTTSTSSTTGSSTTVTTSTQTRSSSTSSTFSTTSSTATSSTSTSMSNTTTSQTETETTTFTGVWYEVVATVYIDLITANAYTMAADAAAINAIQMVVDDLVFVDYTSAELQLPQEGSTIGTFVVFIRNSRRTLDLARPEATRMAERLDALAPNAPAELTRLMGMRLGFRDYVFQVTGFRYSLEILYPGNSGVEVYRSLSSSSTTENLEQAASNSEDFNLSAFLLACSFFLAS